MGLLDGDLAAIVNGALQDIFLNATLSRDTVGLGSPTSDEFDPRPGDLSTTDYSCKAIEEVYYETAMGTTGFSKVRKRRIIILANSLSVSPVQNDRVAIDGRSGTFTILDVDADPARATWTCTEKT